TGQFAAIPQTLYLLMGVNLGAAVASTAITTVKASAAQMGAAANVVPPIAPPAKPTPTVTPPNFVRDIFFEAGIPGSLDLPRTQMFLWTIVTIVTYLVLFGRHFHPAPVVDGFPLMPDVPTGMLALMGVSQGAYLGAKAAR